MRGSCQDILCCRPNTNVQSQNIRKSFLSKFVIIEKVRYLYNSRSKAGFVLTCLVHVEHTEAIQLPCCIFCIVNTRIT